MNFIKNEFFHKFLNMNELARKAQKKTIVLVLASIGALIFVGWIFMHSKTTEKKETENIKQQVVRMDGTVDSQFTQEASQKALEEQQGQIKDMHERLEVIGMQMDALQKTLDEKNSDEIDNGKAQELQTMVAELEAALNKKSGGQSGLANNFGAEAIREARGITTANFFYAGEIQNTAMGDAKNIKERIKTVKNYVPPGTFAKAVLLSGADTNAGVHGQADTIPITMRILDSGTLPNGEHSSLKGCFVTAAAYGDASSERGQIRLQRLSCVRKPNGLILDVPIEGTINDMGGSDGIRGHVIMRNNKLIWNAGVSGMLSGVGSAIQQSLTTQSVSPLGVTNAIQPTKVLQYGAFGGANSALGKLADYYIKLADMYHPIVQIHAGSQVNIVFLKGFSLTEGQGVIDSASLEKAKSIQDGIPQNLMQTIKDSQVGQAVNVNSNGNTWETI
jgi:conjugal transfer pilus assembly protein TraB